MNSFFDCQRNHKSSIIIKNKLRMRKYLVLLATVVSTFAIAQTGKITISIYDDFSKKPLAAKVQVLNSEKEVMGIGSVEIDGLEAGDYSFIISAEGYEVGTLNDISVLPEQNILHSIGLKKNNTRAIGEVVISRKVYKTTPESPVSLRNISSEEVQKNPGSNRDVSKAMLSLPGVGTTATFRNDLFIRGGASSENTFFVDGIEVPVINHFQTQGASGGPRGILTVDFIKDVDFYSGAFPAKRNGTLSSLFEFNLKNARKDKMGYKVILGLDDMQIMADGPLSKDQSWTGLFSVRKSNLQLLFKAIGLPFLPSYYDTNIKIAKKYQSGDELYFIGIGAIDEFTFNQNAKNTPYNLSLIERLPVTPQWNYTIGAGYRHLTENGNWLFTMSRNMLDNKAKKYYRNRETPENILLDYDSQEVENKMRIDRNFRLGDYQMSTGTNVNFANYRNTSLVNRVTATGVLKDEYQTDVELVEYGAYFQGNTKLLDDQLQVSVGLRVDGNSYSQMMNNPLKQFSPRLSLRYALSPKWSLNFNAGQYFMKPAYTAMGFMQNGVLVNQNTLKYIQNAQVVAGLEYKGKNQLRITAETYYKKYKNYPFSLRNGVSMANLGSDFGVIGAEALDSRGVGETYGVEILAQKRTVNNFYGIAAYTFGYSKFSDAVGNLLPSSWDTRHIVSLTAGKYLGRNWNLGARFRMQSGFPQTPYDIMTSGLVNIWNLNNAPVYDYSRQNSLRGNAVHQLDIRAEKKWIFSKWQLTAYMDIVNVYGSKNPSILPVVSLERDTQGNGIIANPSALPSQQRYQLNMDTPDRTTPLPYFGIIVEF